MIHRSGFDKILISVLTARPLTNAELSALLDAVCENEPAGLNLFESYLVSLKRRAISDRELAQLVKLLMIRARRLKPQGNFIDVCGTGGDRSLSFNISTAVAFVLAAGGVPVLKHGNRAVSSRCGSSDLIEALGIRLERASRRALQTLKRLGFGYLHAPFFHPILAKVAPVRRRIEEPTILNCLGPLLHPGSPRVQLVGIGDEGAFRRYAGWLQGAGRRRAIVVRSKDGLDEAAPYGTTDVYELEGGRIRSYAVRARDFGFRARSSKELAVSGTRENLSAFKQVLSGRERGSRREAVLINAGLGFYLSRRSKTLGEGVRLADEVIRSGASKRVLERYREEVR